MLWWDPPVTWNTPGAIWVNTTERGLIRIAGEAEGLPPEEPLGAAFAPHGVGCIKGRLQCRRDGKGIRR